MTTQSICNKPNHLYKRYFCTKCEVYHIEGDANYKKHGDFKINRYYCPICKHTHISSFGDKFLKHLEKRGREISYFSNACSIKCHYITRKNIDLTKEDAIRLSEIQSEIRKDVIDRTWRYHKSFEKFKLLLKYYLPHEIPYVYGMFNHDYIEYSWWLRYRATNELDKGSQYALYGIKNIRMELEIKLRIYEAILHESSDSELCEHARKEIKKIKPEYFTRVRQKRKFHLEIVYFTCSHCNKLIKTEEFRIGDFPETIALPSLNFFLNFSDKFYHSACYDYRKYNVIIEKESKEKS